MPFNVGPLELVIVLVIALLVIGPKRLPEMGNSLGKTIREFRKASTDITEATSMEPEAKPAVQQATASPAAAPASSRAAPRPRPRPQPRLRRLRLRSRPDPSPTTPSQADVRLRSGTFVIGGWHE